MIASRRQNKNLCETVEGEYLLSETGKEPYAHKVYSLLFPAN